MTKHRFFMQLRKLGYQVLEEALVHLVPADDALSVGNDSTPIFSGNASTPIFLRFFFAASEARVPSTGGGAGPPRAC